MVVVQGFPLGELVVEQLVISDAPRRAEERDRLGAARRGLAAVPGSISRATCSPPSPKATPRWSRPRSAPSSPSPAPLTSATSWKSSSPCSAASSPRWRRCSATRPSQIPADGQGIMPLRCCTLLLYQARELWAQDFEFISLTWVELRGFEPLTSCMPSTGRTSTSVYRRRSPSQSVYASPARSAPVAVFSCCTGQPARSGSQ
jgi:hypothetical protein